MTLVDTLAERSSQKLLGITFVEKSDQEDFLSYHSLYTAAVKLLSFLQKKGIQPKSELVLQIDDNKNFLIVFWACILGGIIPVPLSTAKTDDHHKKFAGVWSLLTAPSLIISSGALIQLEKYLLNQGLNDIFLSVRSKVLLAEEAFSSGAKGTIYHSQEHDIAFLQFSSGSTGNPKGVVLTHANLIANATGIASAARYSEKDRLLSWMPLTHDMGMIGFHLSPMICGLDQYLMSTRLFVRNPLLWMEKTSEHQITVTSSPNFGYQYLLKHLNGNENWDLSCLRIIYNGAEPISASLCRDFNEQLAKFGLSDTAMCPVYGLAEASVAVSISPVEQKVTSLTLNRYKLNPGDEIEETTDQLINTTLVNVGQPVDGCLLQISDENNQPLHDKTIGQVKIKGTNVTGGYYNNISAFKAITDEQGWLNTGDLGFIKDGSLYITGRAKDVIFINGQNFYAHDIEKEAQAVEGIELNKVAVCGTFNTQSRSEEVIAFLTWHGELQKLIPVAHALKICINEKIGIDLNKIIPVKNIPKTTSGKLQRFKLRESYRNGEFQAVESEFAALLRSYDDAIVPAANDIEEKLLGIWRTILQTQDIGVENKFIQSGGNSLKAAELSMNIQREFQVNLSIEKLYEFQTVRALAAEITNLEHKAYQPIPKIALADSYPASISQRRIYYAWKKDPNSVAYNMPVAIKLEGPVDREKLRIVLAHLICRHAALRMIFSPGETPRFSIKENWDVTLELVKCEKSDYDEKLRSLVMPFDLEKGPLFRFFLLDLHRGDPREFVLLLDFHHIISDGRSAYLFVDELLKGYNGIVPPAANTAFADFTAWEMEQSRNIKESEKQFWIDRFSDELPHLQIPCDFPRPATLNGAGKRLAFNLNTTVAAKLKNIQTRYNITGHSLFFTLYTVLLSKYSGAKDIIIGVPTHGRLHPDLQRVQGLFVNNLPIRSIIRGDLTFIRLLLDTSGMISEAIDHQELAFDDLLNILNIRSSPARSPLFDTMFLYQNQDITAKHTGFTAKRYLFDPGFSKFDISLEVFEEGKEIGYAFEYSTQLFKEESILELSAGLQNIIRQITEDPTIRIEDISALSEEEFNECYTPYKVIATETDSFVPVDELFEQEAGKHPDNIAIEIEGDKVTYKELNSKVNQIAGFLNDKGINKGDLVAVCLKRSPELVATLLGILRSGAAFLPLEWGIPPERMKFIIDNSGCKLVVDDAAIAAVKAACKRKAPVVNRNHPSDLAYVLYTSGTTGQPKGVMIEHGSFLNYIAWAAERYIDPKGCSFAFYSSISFDLTLTSVFLPLVTGNKMVIYEEKNTAVSIETVIRDNRVDIIKLTPSHLRILKENNLLPATSKVNRLIVGGEALDTVLARDVYKQLRGQVQIFNEYGPTEATVGCMIYKFDPDDDTATVPIGRPIVNTRIYLLDDELKPVPTNVPGQLYIAGKGLARGYLFLEALTRERFIEDPFIKGERMYKTGDIAKRLPNRDLEYIGRNDKQVKISGHRVELAEIETQLMRSGKVREAIVLVDTANPDQIHAYFAPIDPDDQWSDVEFRNYLAEKLPYFMIPGEFISVKSMPLTRNGKVDTTSLRELKPAHSTRKRTSPQNEIEQVFMRIWAGVLNIEEIGVTDNFFELGGDSIKAVQISSRLYEEGIEVKVKDILTYHTIEHTSRRAQRVSGLHSIAQEIAEGLFAPTPVQRWFFSQRFENPNYYNQSVLLAIRRPLDLSLLGRTFKALIEHHDTLRVNYNAVTHSFFYNNEHLSEDPVIQEFEIGDDRLLSDICNEIRRSLHVQNSLLMKMAIIRKPGENEFLFITAHHLIMDGISWRIFLEDFHRAYTAMEAGNTPGLPPKTASFKDWSVFVNELSASPAMEEEKGYWKEMQTTAFRLPVDLHPGVRATKAVRSAAIRLDRETTAFLLKDAHKPYNTDVLILLNCALVLTLNKWTGSTEFVIEQESHGRPPDGLNVSRTIGWFTSIYPLKFEYTEEIDLLIRSVKERMRKVPHNGIGFAICTSTLHQPEPTDIRFNYLGAFGAELNNTLFILAPDANGTEFDPQNAPTAKLEFNAMVVGGEFQLEIVYASALFNESTIGELAQGFSKNLTDILSYLENEDEQHFTPSDFSAAALDEDELKLLFNGG